jgi:F-type H+-transporting ATPase subunit gamma
MATLRDIRIRLKGVKNTSKITQAMKMVSASKLRRAQEAIESARPYFNKFDDLVSNLIGGVSDSYQNEILNSRTTVKNIAIIVVSSDRGLCGSFNSNLFKFVKNFISDELVPKYKDASISFITAGRKSTSFYNKEDINVLNSFPGIFSQVDFNDAINIVNEVKEKFILGELDLVYVIGNEFVNVIKQTPKAKQLLPLVPKVSSGNAKSSFTTDYVYEPNATEILDNLLPKLVNLTVWRAILDSNAAEHAARMMAMDNATRNAKDLINILNLQYNSKRQAAITTEMLEIVGGAEALNN